MILEGRIIRFKYMCDLIKIVLVFIVKVDESTLREAYSIVPKTSIRECCVLLLLILDSFLKLQYVKRSGVTPPRPEEYTIVLKIKHGCKGDC